MKIIKLAICSFLMLLSVSSFADKVVITGEPVVLQEQDGVWIVPDTYTTTNDYNYVTVGGMNSVCYAQAQPTLSAATMKVVDVQIGGKKVQWTCYNYDDAYFTVTNP